MSFSYTTAPPPERSPPLAAMQLSPAPPPGSRRAARQLRPDLDVDTLDLNSRKSESETSSLHRSKSSTVTNTLRTNRMSTPIVVPKMRNPLPANFEHQAAAGGFERDPSPSPSWESNVPSSPSRSGSSHCSSTASSVKSKRRRTITAKSSFTSLHEALTPTPLTPTNGSFIGRSRGKSISRVIAGVGDYFTSKIVGKEDRSDSVPDVPKIPAHLAR